MCVCAPLWVIVWTVIVLLCDPDCCIISIRGLARPLSERSWIWSLFPFANSSSLWRGSLCPQSVETIRSDLTFDPHSALQPRSSPSADGLFFETETSEDEDDSDDDDDDDNDDRDNEDESDSDDGGCEESGLGLLARFAASAIPVSSTPLSLLHDGKHHSRQSTLGKNT